MEHAPKFKIGIIGLGYVGLPLAKLFLEGGNTVYGIDADERKINMLMKYQSYLSDFKRTDIRKLFSKNSFHVSTKFDVIEKVDVIILCVPTPLDEQHQPDLSYVIGAAQSSLPYLHRGQLIVLESSTFPGTSEERLKPMLESTGLLVGKDISLAYSPERIDPGSKWELEQIPKVVGGVTPSCTAYAKQVYGSVFNEVVLVSSPRVAEMTKLLENCQRYLNISFMNSLLKLSEELDINLWEAIEAAGTKPFGFTKYYPGPGVGGHCIPVDPLYLLWKAREHHMDLPFIDLCHQVNEDMPGYIVGRVAKSLQPKALKECSVLVIGVTYKKDVNDMRESVALPIMEHLLQAGVKLGYFDPYVKALKIGETVLHSTPLTARKMKNYDCTLILTDHSNIPYELLVAHTPIVIDTRNATGKMAERENVILL
ncbi:UDP-N-acetyl-D-glucosamine dehydrogenase [Paenibacillus sp. BIHB 4019]|uniref:UDP-N-acetyl-D-glucosamine dehydrogenase n=1 Tax=Paenibacillus sp. BIHB 4019 TaxID=1870819 RepID=A0A1B2DES4_9BACL|nr:nucleotide sugar dehydrogenase [Paenibacillus sp. BIHB 4019]ANY66214.1 UDP-N-acetyl-D-glucosamine dehydrogenase [Paenibacillus sp. BIHB 4019]